MLIIYYIVLKEGIRNGCFDAKNGCGSFEMQGFGKTNRSGEVKQNSRRAPANSGTPSAIIARSK